MACWLSPHTEIRSDSPPLSSSQRDKYTNVLILSQRPSSPWIKFSVTLTPRHTFLLIVYNLTSYNYNNGTLRQEASDAWLRPISRVIQLLNIHLYVRDCTLWSTLPGVEPRTSCLKVHDATTKSAGILSLMDNWTFTIHIYMNNIGYTPAIGLSLRVWWTSKHGWPYAKVDQWPSEIL